MRKRDYWKPYFQHALDVLVDLANAQDMISRVKECDLNRGINKAESVSHGLRLRIRERSSGDSVIRDQDIQYMQVRDPVTGEVLGNVKPSRNGPYLVVDDKVDGEALKERTAINSKKGAETEKDEEAIRKDREVKRARAENHAGDELVEARENLADYKRQSLFMNFVVVPASLGLALGPILLLWISLWFIAPMVIGGILLAATGGRVISWQADRTRYNLEKQIRDAEAKYRDVTDRPIEWYDRKDYDNL